MRMKLQPFLALIGSMAVLTGCLPDFVTVPSEEEFIAEGLAPTGLVLSSEPTPWQANLQWADHSQIETSFHIQRRTLDAEGTPDTEYADVGTAVINQVWWADQNVETDTTYEYRVEAFQGLLSLGASSSVQTVIPTYQPVTTHEHSGPMTYETVVFSERGLGYPTVIYDVREIGLLGFYWDGKGFHGPMVIGDGLGRYDRVEKTHRLWWDGDTLYRVADIRNQANEINTLLQGWLRTGSRLELVSTWGHWFTHAEGSVYGSAQSGDRRVVFIARSGSLCPIVLTAGISPSVSTSHSCLATEAAAAIDSPHAMIGFDEGTRLYLSAQSGGHVVNIETPGLMSVLSTRAGAPQVLQFTGTGENVWGRTAEGQFVAFQNTPDYNAGGGDALETELDLSAAEYQYTAYDGGSRQFTLSCSQGAEVYWDGRVLQAMPLEHCAVAAMLLDSRTLWLVADTGKLVTYDLSPRFGSWSEDRRR